MPETRQEHLVALKSDSGCSSRRLGYMQQHIFIFINTGSVCFNPNMNRWPLEGALNTEDADSSKDVQIQSCFKQIIRLILLIFVVILHSSLEFCSLLRL